MRRFGDIFRFLLVGLPGACTGDATAPTVVTVVPSVVSLTELPAVVAVEGFNLTDGVSVSLDDERAVQRRHARVTIGNVALTSLPGTSSSRWLGTVPVGLGVGVHDVTATLDDGRRHQLVGGFTVLEPSELVSPPAVGCNGEDFGVPQTIWAEGSDRDFGPALSADRLTLVFARETAGHLDLYWAQRASVSAAFGAAIHIPELSGGNNTAPILSHDGRRLYFASDRSGSWDIWGATRTQFSSTFGDLHALSEINSPRTDSRPWLAADELTLYFESDRNPATGYDLWQASRAHREEPFSLPTQVPQMGSPSLEGSPSLTPDGLTLYYTSDVVPPSGRRILHRSRRLSTQDPFAPGTAVAALASHDMSGHSHLSADGRELVFSAASGTGQRLWRVLIDCTDNE